MIKTRSRLAVFYFMFLTPEKREILFFFFFFFDFLSIRYLLRLIYSRSSFRPFLNKGYPVPKLASIPAPIACACVETKESDDSTLRVQTCEIYALLYPQILSLN